MPAATASKTPPAALVRTVGQTSATSSPARFYVFFGMIAAGKSTLAKAWAARHSLSYHNSDVVRKELAGLAAATRRPEDAAQGIYSPEFSRLTYDELLCRAATDLHQNKKVVLDAAYLGRLERDEVNALAGSLGLIAHFVLCECSDQVRRERLAIRAGDPQAVSDGRWEIYHRQRDKFQYPVELSGDQLLVINTAQPLERLLNELEATLKN